MAAAAAFGGTRVVGLRDLQSELRAADDRLPRELRRTNLNVAELVAREARGRARSQGGVAAKTAPSIKALAQQRSAAVRIGGAKYPYWAGAEFGAIRDIPRGPYQRENTGPYTVRGWNQFKPWRGNQYISSATGPGYFLYPSIRDLTDEITEVYADMIGGLYRRAFPA